ncbi:peptidase inhibitor family I36 protein [Streptomyces sp. NPDC006339]|uniref:peptidase inhibitor family I36 protein n=1 Tax=Streptomyces sp. NPDC006339 TaxID=3156755 RepID=UPI0033A156B4
MGPRLHRSLAAAVLICAALAPTSAASAADSVQAPDDCAAEMVCFYTQPNYQGRRFDYHNPEFATCGYVETIHVGEPTRSVWNNDDTDWDFFASRHGCWPHAGSWNVRSGQGQASMEAWFWK